MTPPASDGAPRRTFSARAAVIDMDRWLGLSHTGPTRMRTGSINSALDDGLYRFIRREPERSARILRLLFTAGYLAQCDRPARHSGPSSSVRRFMIYDHDAATPQPVREISPEVLEAWTMDSIFAETLAPSRHRVQGLLDAELGTFDQTHA